MPTNKNKILILFSGGVDSTYMVFNFLRNGYEVYPLFFDKEGIYSIADRSAAYKAYRWLIEYQKAGTGKLHPLLMQKYEPVLDGTEEKGRHLYMLGVAVIEALKHGCGRIGIGVYDADDEQAGDTLIYPDSTVWFISAYRAAMKLSQVGIYLDTLGDMARSDIFYEINADGFLHGFCSSVSFCYNRIEDKALLPEVPLRGCGHCTKCLETINYFKEFDDEH